jgi:hypothetical protein
VIWYNTYVIKKFLSGVIWQGELEDEKFNLTPPSTYYKMHGQALRSAIGRGRSNGQQANQVFRVCSQQFSTTRSQGFPEGQDSAGADGTRRERSRQAAKEVGELLKKSMGSGSATPASINPASQSNYPNGQGESRIIDMKSLPRGFGSNRGGRARGANGTTRAEFEAKKSSAGNSYSNLITGVPSSFAARGRSLRGQSFRGHSFRDNAASLLQRNGLNMKSSPTTGFRGGRGGSGQRGGISRGRGGAAKPRGRGGSARSRLRRRAKGGQDGEQQTSYGRMDIEPETPEEFEYMEARAKGIPYAYKPSTTAESLLGFGPPVASDSTSGRVETVLRNLRTLGGVPQSWEHASDTAAKLKRQGAVVFRDIAERKFVEENVPGLKLKGPDDLVKTTIIQKAIQGQHETPIFAPLTNPVGLARSWHVREETYTPKDVQSFETKLITLLPAQKPAATGADGAKRSKQAKA